MRRAAVLIAAAICLAISIPKVAREIYWARSPDFYRVYDHGKWQDFVAVAQYLRERGRPDADEVIGPATTVIHYLSGLRVATDLLAPGYPPWDPTSGPPQVFAEAAARGTSRFVIVPTDAPDWSGPAMAAIEAGGAFGPPRLFGVGPGEPLGRLAVYERRTVTP